MPVTAVRARTTRTMTSGSGEPLEVDWLEVSPPAGLGCSDGAAEAVAVSVGVGLACAEADGDTDVEAAGEPLTCWLDPDDAVGR